MATIQVEVPDGKTMLPPIFVPDDKVDIIREAYASLVEDEGTLQERAELAMKITLRRPVSRYIKTQAASQADTSNIF